MPSENQPAASPKFTPRNRGEEARAIIHDIMLSSMTRVGQIPPNPQKVAFELAFITSLLAERDCAGKSSWPVQEQCKTEALDSYLQQFEKAASELSGKIPKAEWSRNNNVWFDAGEKVAEKLRLRAPEPDADFICPQSYKLGEVPICYLKEKSARQRGR
jgi:hypothetical protein